MPPAIRAAADCAGSWPWRPSRWRRPCWPGVCIAGAGGSCPPMPSARNGRAWPGCCCGLAGPHGRWRCGLSGAGAGRSSAARGTGICCCPCAFSPCPSPPPSPPPRPAARPLLPGLPALAALAPFALPTLRRSVGALIDWFTLLFFSASALAIWVIWIAMQTGFPAKPAANVAKLAPDFVPQFSALALAPALAATALWCLLVWWRAARDRAPIWKSLVLPASGATLGWLLLMTLWLPLLDHARSYGPQVRSVVAALGPAPGCIQTLGLHRGQVAALQYHDRLALQP